MQLELQLLRLPKWLAGQDGNLCVYEVAHTYLPIKYLCTTNQQQPGCMAVSPDSSLLAAVSHTGPASLVSPALTGTEKSRALLGTLALQPHMSGHQRFLRDCQHLPTYCSEVCIAQLSSKG